MAYGLRANYNFLVRKAWKEALHDATNARKDCNRVSELDPSNYDARLIQGVHDYVVGSLPWGWRMLGAVVNGAPEISYASDYRYVVPKGIK